MGVTHRLPAAPLATEDAWNGTTAFTRMYARDGTVAWEDQVGSIAPVRADGVTVDGSNRLIVVGSMENTAFASASGDSDAWLRVYQPDGAIASQRHFGALRVDAAFDVALDAAQHIVIAGTTVGALAGAHVGAGDALVGTDTPDGALARALQYGSDAYGDAYSASIDAPGRITAIHGVTQTC